MMNKLGTLLWMPLRHWKAQIQHFMSGLYLELIPTLDKFFLPTPAVDGEEQHQSLEFPWEGLLWGVPKKRTSYTKKRLRNTHKYLKRRCDFAACPKCKNFKLLHVLCGHCLKQTLQETANMRQEEILDKLRAAAKKQGKDGMVV